MPANPNPQKEVAMTSEPDPTDSVEEKKSEEPPAPGRSWGSTILLILRAAWWLFNDGPLGD